MFRVFLSVCFFLFAGIVSAEEVAKTSIEVKVDAVKKEVKETTAEAVLRAKLAESEERTAKAELALMKDRSTRYPQQQLSLEPRVQPEPSSVVQQQPAQESVSVTTGGQAEFGGIPLPARPSDRHMLVYVGKDANGRDEFCWELPQQPISGPRMVWDYQHWKKTGVWELVQLPEGTALNNDGIWRKLPEPPRVTRAVSQPQVEETVVEQPRVEYRQPVIRQETVVVYTDRNRCPVNGYIWYRDRNRWDRPPCPQSGWMWHNDGYWYGSRNQHGYDRWDSRRGFFSFGVGANVNIGGHR